MDEALNGLDPRSARLVKDLLRKLASEGVSILFSTHVLEIAAGALRQGRDNVPGEDRGGGHRGRAQAEGGLPGSTLEEVFLKMTGTDDLGEVVKELSQIEGRAKRMTEAWADLHHQAAS